MAANTWTVSSGYSSVDLLTERGHVYSGIVGIQNTGDDTIEIRSVFQNRRMAAAVVGSGQDTLYKVSAMSGGTVVAPVKNDTASSNLPAQILIAAHPTSYTITDLHRQIPTLGGFNFITSLSVPHLGRQRTQGRGWSSVAQWDRSASTIQRLVIREGEGAVYRHEAGVRVRTQYTRMIIRDSTNNATYTIFSTEATPRDEQDVMLGIFNGSGSGIVLEITILEEIDVGFGDVQPVGGTNFNVQPGYPGFRMMLCGRLLEGTVLTPVAYDTSNPSLPATVVAKRDPLIATGRVQTGRDRILREIESGIQGTSTTVFSSEGYAGLVRPVMSMPHEYDPTVANLFLNNPKQLRRVRGAAARGLILKKDQAFAVAQGYWPGYNMGASALYMNTYAVYDIGFEFTHTPAVVVTPSAGGIARARVIGGV